MLDTPIITRLELQKMKQISDSGNDDNLHQTIIEAQIQDLRTLLGEELFNAVLKDVRDTGNTNGTIYTDLLNGGEFQCDNKTYYHAGIKDVLSNYVYGRHIMWGDIVDNPFGARIKINSNTSMPVSSAVKKSRYEENRNFAYNIWLGVRRFLILTKEPLFKCHSYRPKRGLKIRKIG